MNKANRVSSLILFLYLTKEEQLCILEKQSRFENLGCFLPQKLPILDFF